MNLPTAADGQWRSTRWSTGGVWSDRHRLWLRILQNPMPARRRVRILHEVQQPADTRWSCLHDTIDFKNRLTGKSLRRYSGMPVTDSGISMHKFRAHVCRHRYLHGQIDLPGSLPKCHGLHWPRSFQSRSDSPCRFIPIHSVRRRERHPTCHRSSAIQNKWPIPDNFSSEEASPVLTNVEQNRPETYQVTGYYFAAQPIRKGVNVDIKLPTKCWLGQWYFLLSQGPP